MSSPAERRYDIGWAWHTFRTFKQAHPRSRLLIERMKDLAREGGSSITEHEIERWIVLCLASSSLQEPWESFKKLCKGTGPLPSDTKVQEFLVELYKKLNSMTLSPPYEQGLLDQIY